MPRLSQERLDQLLAAEAQRDEGGDRPTHRVLPERRDQRAKLFAAGALVGSARAQAQVVEHSTGWRALLRCRLGLRRLHVVHPNAR